MANQYQVQIGGDMTDYATATEASDAFGRGSRSGVPCALWLGDAAAHSANGSHAAPNEAARATFGAALSAEQDAAEALAERNARIDAGLRGKHIGE